MKLIVLDRLIALKEVPAHEKVLQVSSYDFFFLIDDLQGKKKAMIALTIPSLIQTGYSESRCTFSNVSIIYKVEGWDLPAISSFLFYNSIVRQVFRICHTVFPKLRF